MTLEEAVRKLRRIRKGDNEAAHALADDILLEYLKHNGADKLARAWKDAETRCGGFYYA